MHNGFFLVATNIYKCSCIIYRFFQKIFRNRWIEFLDIILHKDAFLFFMLSNQVITESASLHWFTADISRALVLIFSIKNLLTLPISLLAELISLHFGFDWKFSWCSFKVTNAFDFEKQSTLSPISYFSAIFFCFSNLFC